MAGGIEIKMELKGGKELAAALRGLPDAMEKSVLQSALRTVGKPFQALMSVHAPVLTGALAAHIVMSTVKPETAGSTAALAIGPDQKRFYGLFAEFGTKHQPARPWMRPVIDSQSPQAVEEFGLIVWKKLIALARKLSRGKA